MKTLISIRAPGAPPRAISWGARRLGVPRASPDGVGPPISSSSCPLRLAEKPDVDRGPTVPNSGGAPPAPPAAPAGQLLTQRSGRANSVPVREQRSTAVRKRSAAVAIPRAPAPGQPLVLRQRGKVVLLPGDTATALAPEWGSGGAGGGDGDRGSAAALWEEIPGDDEDGTLGSTGRVTIYCIGEALQREPLERLLQQRFPDCRLNSYPDVLHLELPATEGKWAQDVFMFDYGVVCSWGLSQAGEHEVVQLAKACSEEPLPQADVEIDQFRFLYSVNEPPSMSNDTITINRRQAADHQAKLAICHALAQSTKLSVSEERVTDLVLKTKHLPQQLAVTGTVDIKAKEVAQLIGQVFLQRSTVNLLSSVLDTPEFFWSAPDSMQVLYERACVYLELEERVEVLNARFEVLQDMLDMLRDSAANQHSSHLEWIIIWLIAVELVLGLVELGALYGGSGLHLGS